MDGNVWITLTVELPQTLGAPALRFPKQIYDTVFRFGNNFFAQKSHNLHTKGKAQPKRWACLVLWISVSRGGYWQDGTGINNMLNEHCGKTSRRHQLILLLCSLWSDWTTSVCGGFHKKLQYWLQQGNSTIWVVASWTTLLSVFFTLLG